MKHVLIIALLTLAAAPAQAGAGGFTIVNGAGTTFKQVAVRRMGTRDWRELRATPPPGARQAVDFTDPDCAFDIRASLDGKGELVWTGVNLCEVKTVTLNRSAAGQLWVDYE